MKKKTQQKELIIKDLTKEQMEEIEANFRMGDPQVSVSRLPQPDGRWTLIVEGGARDHP